MVLVAATGSACAPSPEADPDTTALTGATNSTVPAQCSPDTAGDDPPPVRLVGQTTQVVPFYARSCPGFDADSFADPAEYPVVSDEGTVDLFLANRATEILVTIRDLTADPSREFELKTETVAPGQVRIVVPDPDATWVVRIRIATADYRIVYYTAVFKPAT